MGAYGLCLLLSVVGSQIPPSGSKPTSDKVAIEQAANELAKEDAKLVLALQEAIAEMTKNMRETCEAINVFFENDLKIPSRCELKKLRSCMVEPGSILGVTIDGIDSGHTTRVTQQSWASEIRRCLKKSFYVPKPS